MSKPNKIVYLKWLDHCRYPGWLDDDKSYPPMGVETIGFILSETDDYIVISNSLTDVDSANDPFTIIKSCILEFHEVEWVKGRKK